MWLMDILNNNLLNKYICSHIAVISAVLSNEKPTKELSHNLLQHHYYEEFLIWPILINLVEKFVGFIQFLYLLIYKRNWEEYEW